MTHTIDPPYRDVVFRDKLAGLVFRTRSTAPTTETIDFEGETLPLIDVQVSSASHPFWTGRSRVMDSEGRVERFQRRYGRASQNTNGKEATP
ncbi:MAG TPA: type B 50S ribosomal protein L31 [Arachnia sp.]|nr:type B 50S ribosomal protein L31 [Arachnia sp.]HMT85561.1 type B 50S ribosomal protein L31 [Arachnia sp.]